LIPPALHILGVYARCARSVHLPKAAFVAALEVDVFEVEGVDVAGKVAMKEGGRLAGGMRVWGEGSGGRLVGGMCGGRKMER